jgi:hypothetical protein
MKSKFNLSKLTLLISVTLASQGYSAMAQSPAAQDSASTPTLTITAAPSTQTAVLETTATVALTPVTVTSAVSAAPLALTVIKAQYTEVYPDGSRLKDVPKEVTIVRRANTQKNVVGQVALNVLMLAVGGFGGFSGFSKDGLLGSPIEGLTERENIQNQIPRTYGLQLQHQVNEWIATQSAYSSKIYSNPLLIAGGQTRLVYENLAGTDEEKFRLKTTLSIYKRKEKTGFFGDPNIAVGCDDTSTELLLEKEWALDNYRLVKTQMDAALKACNQKVVSELPSILKD